jgi:hypothetical protein
MAAHAWRFAISCAVACIGCGPESNDADDGSTGSTGSVATTTSTDDASTRGSESMDTGATTTRTSTSTSTTTTDTDVATLDTGHGTCGDVDVSRCEDVGCAVYSEHAFRYDASAGECIDLGPYDLCLSAGGSQAPSDVWRIDERGEVIVVPLNVIPFDLGEGPWSGCGCRAGDPFACWGCATQTSGCGFSEANCGDATTPEACAAEPSGECQWVDTVVVAGDGSECKEVEQRQRCITVLSAKGSCAVADPPASCDALPFVRAVDGGIEIMTGVACDDWPVGYMPCWSAPAGDPAACSCAC